MFLFSSLHQRIYHYLSAEDVNLIAKAYLLAADAHEAQYRTSGECYIHHPVAVAGILAEMYMDRDTICAALMHDVLEDTNVEASEIESIFGEKVLSLVEGVTKLTKIDYKDKAEEQAENFRKMILAMVEDVRVIIIKLADRLHNMQTADVWRPDKRRRKGIETLDIYAPLANRLGMNFLKNQLQDLGFKACYPMRYKVIEACAKKALGHRKKLFRTIEISIAEALKDAKIEFDTICSRQKRLYSIFRKMRNKGVPFSEVMDMFGVRIVVQDKNQCYQAIGVVHSLYKPVPGRFKDYIAIAKSNGYQSLHSTLFGPHGVPIEVQVRTTEMDSMAEHGIAAHWLYKSGGYASSDEIHTRKWMQGLLEMQMRSGSSVEFIENVKVDLFPHDVFVFTPKGKIMELPRGATPVDFAYAVHTQVGHHAHSAKVNRRLVPLNYRLQSGQTVEIITKDSALPNHYWLDYVISGKAKTAIRHFLKESETKESSHLGQKLLNVALENYQMQFEDIHANSMEQYLKQINLDSKEALFDEIGHGERSAAMVATGILQLGQKTKSAQAKASVDTAKDAPMAIEGSEGMALQYAKCCYPIPGDSICGVIVKGRGVMVHRAKCPKIMNKIIPGNDDWMHLVWGAEVSGKYLSRLCIETENYLGALGDITTNIAMCEGDIQNCTTNETQDSFAVIDIELNVSSREHLARIIRHLRRISGVMRVYRYKNKK